MNNQLSPRDVQTLSDYLDGHLNRKEQSNLEIRLQDQAELRDELEALKKTRLMLQKLPRRRAPRNFTLSPSMAPKRPAARLFPVFSMASALAGLLLVAAFAGNFFLGGAASGARSLAFNTSSAERQGKYLAAPAIAANPTSPIIIWDSGGGGGKGGGGGSPQAASPANAGIAPPSTDQSGTEPALGALPAPTEAPDTNHTASQPTEGSTPANPPPAALAQATAAPAATQEVSPRSGLPAAGASVLQSNPSAANNGPILGVQPTENQGQIESTSAPAQEEQNTPVSVWPLAEDGAGLLTVLMVLAAIYFYRKERV